MLVRVLLALAHRSAGHDDVGVARARRAVLVSISMVVLMCARTRACHGVLMLRVRVRVRVDAGAGAGASRQGRSVAQHQQGGTQTTGKGSVQTHGDRRYQY